MAGGSERADPNWLEGSRFMRRPLSWSDEDGEYAGTTIWGVRSRLGNALGAGPKSRSPHTLGSMWIDGQMGHYLPSGAQAPADAPPTAPSDPLGSGGSSWERFAPRA